MSRDRTLVATLVTLALLGSVAVPTAAAVTPATDSATDGDVLVVDDDGDGDYRSIAAAAANASDGDTVRVRPGTYRGGIELAANVTVVAPRGATVAGPGFGANESAPDTAFRIVSESGAAPVVSGFTITGFFDGVSAWNTTGDWTLQDTTVRYPINNGVQAISSRGDWRLENVTVRNASEAVVAIDTEGDWTVEDSTLRGAEQAVEASSATGDWTLRNVTVTGDVGPGSDDEPTLVGVAARNASGDWTVEDATVRNAVVGVSAYEASGNWTVASTTFRDLSESERYDFVMPPLPEGVGVFAGRATGTWAVRNATFVGVTGAGIDASGASQGGTASGNEFRAVGEGRSCVGNVRCGRATAERTATPTPTPGATPGESPTATADTPTASPTGTPSTPTGTDGSRSDRTTGTDGTVEPTRSPTGDRTTAGDGRLPVRLVVLAVAAVGLLLGRRTG